MDKKENMEKIDIKKKVQLNDFAIKGDEIIYYKH